jgi:hypothetical protein
MAANLIYRQLIKMSTKMVLEEDFKAAGAAISDNSVGGHIEGNKRLALAGDTLIQLIILSKWYHSKQSIGKTTFLAIQIASSCVEEGAYMVSELGNNDALATLAHRWVYLNILSKIQAKKETWQKLLSHLRLKE